MNGVESLRPGAWRDSPSPLGWMSMRDGKLLATLLVNTAPKREPLRVLEWGSGQSTLSFTRILSSLSIPFHWISLEYDRKFFDTTLAPKLAQRPHTVIRYPDDDKTISFGRRPEGSLIEAVCWNRTRLKPAEDLSDRLVDLDDYVNYPSTHGLKPHVVLVDGRMRRRCLLLAAGLIDSGALVMLHDAWHPFYHCALGGYPARRFVGDEFWAGARSDSIIRAALQPAARST